MTKSLKPSKEYYSEVEAAEYLDISIEHLYSLLDEHIFNDGSVRPGDLAFCDADLVLLGFWLKSQENPKVIRMPRRY
jgi:prophage maintenance system killer protein